MSTVVLCYEGADGNPVAVSSTTPLPLSDAGAVQSTEVGQPNGVASLDGSGKIPTSQMPVGDVTYIGNWNAATNTPTLANGVGTAGELYICDVAGSQNLGGGVVAYGVGDWLIYDGTVWDSISGHGPAPANPSVTVGLAAKNGTAPTFMRSDAAPALDQTITPTWTGLHAFNGGVTVNETGAEQVRIVNDQQFSGAAAALVVEGNNANGPGFGIGNTSQGADGKWWDIIPVTTSLNYRIVNDAGNASKNYMQIVRSANVVQSVTWGNVTDNPSYLWAGTGPWTVGGSTGITGQALMSNGNAIAPSWTAVAAIVSGVSRTAQAANVNVSNFYQIPVAGMYRVSVYLVLSQAATTSSVLPSCSIGYTEAVTGAAVQDLITQTANTNLVGLHTSGTAVIQAQLGAQLTLTTGSYASVGATAMQYSVHATVERLA